jgi:hypothetical protein
MSLPRLLSLITFLAFAAWTAYLCRGYNYLTFFHPVLSSGPGIQVLTDLTIAQSLILIWMFRDAGKAGRKFWPYLLITAAFGSFGPLLYLILGKNSEEA